jgi:Zn-dependent protease/CBS domain-containing protein
VGSSFKIGRIFGIEVGVHWSWIFILLLITWSFAEGVLSEFYPDWTAAQRWAVGAIVSAIFFASILAHELSHSVVAKARGIGVTGITLFIFGGVSNLEREARTASEEFWIAIVGPLTSLAVGGLFAILWVALYNVSSEASAIAGYLAFLNVIIAVFNLLPGFPLDGGRVFRAIVWWRNRNLLRATRIASRTGEGVAYLLMGGGVLQFLFTDNFVGGVWLFLIGLFLRNASSQSYEHMVLQQTLSGVTARDVARTDIVGLAPDMTIAQVVAELMLAGKGRAYPVLAGQELLGLITLTDVQRLEREQWPETSVYRAMTPAERLHTVTQDQPVEEVLEIMGEHDVNQVPVMDGRLLYGMVSRGDIFHLIQMRQAVNAGT